MRNCHQRLAALRLMAGLSAREAAKRLGLGLRQYMALERGELSLTPQLVDAIAAMYDIPPQSVCAGALPIPRSYGYPFDAEDEITEHLLTLYELYTIIDRWRQALGDEWPEYRKRLEAATQMSLATPYPNPTVLLPSGVPVVIRFDLPHTFRTKRVQVPITVVHNDRKMEYWGPFELGPGVAEFRAPRAVRLYVSPKVV